MAIYTIIDHIASAEDQIFSDKLNPRPRKLLSKISQNDWTAERRAKQWEVRASAEHVINESNDAQGIPVHLHFVHVKTPDNPYNQRMMFVFPESNEEVRIWRHIYKWRENQF